MKKTTSPFLFYITVTITVLGLLYLISIALIHSKVTLSKPEFNPKLSPKYVELLKLQADERKILFKDFSLEVAELKKKHQQQKPALMVRHREERKKFLEERHDIVERKEFFNRQRNEMAFLQASQKQEMTEATRSIALRRTELLSRQKQERLGASNAKPDPQQVDRSAVIKSH